MNSLHQEMINMERILITGSAGFIGFHLLSKLKNLYEVQGIDFLHDTKFATRTRASILDEVIQQSIHAPFIDHLLLKPDVVIHLAAETGIAGSLLNPALYFYQNVEGTFNVLEQCRKNGVKYLIYASSSSVYEPNQSIMHEESPHNHQLSFYGTSKRMTEVMIENYCKQFGIIAIGLRFFTVYGSWTRPDMAAYKFMEAIESERPITLYNEGTISRDFTHVSDVVHAISLLVEKIKHEKKGTHKVFNIGLGSPISVKKYAELIARSFNKELKFESKKLPSNELVSTYSDSSKLAQFIQFRPICSIQDGIEEMTNWFKTSRYEE